MSTEFWNSRYNSSQLAYGEPPNQYLHAQGTRFLTPGMQVLALGDGEGRNGHWLAKRQMEVWSVDYASVGLKKSQKISRSLKLPVRYICVDLTDWPWPVNFFDAVISIFVHFPPLTRMVVHHNIVASLVPGGILILQGFSPKQLSFSSGGPRSVEMLYTPEMLSQDLSGLEFWDMEEKVVELREGEYHDGLASVINLTGFKPREIGNKQRVENNIYLERD